MLHFSDLPPVPNWLNWAALAFTLAAPFLPWASRRLRDIWASRSRERALRRVREMARMYAYLERVRASAVVTSAYVGRVLLIDLVALAITGMMASLGDPMQVVGLAMFCMALFGAGRDIDRLGDLMDGERHKERVMKRGAAILAKTKGVEGNPDVWMRAVIEARLNDCPLAPRKEDGEVSAVANSAIGNNARE